LGVLCAVTPLPAPTKPLDSPLLLPHIYHPPYLSAFNYILFSCGELVAFGCVCTLVRSVEARERSLLGCLLFATALPTLFATPLQPPTSAFALSHPPGPNHQILEYVLANAAVARSFAPYFGQLVGKGSTFFVFERPGDIVVDPLGAGLVAVCVGLVMTSTEHSNTTNLILTIVHVVVVLMIMIVGEWLRC